MERNSLDDVGGSRLDRWHPEQGDYSEGDGEESRARSTAGRAQYPFASIEAHAQGAAGRVSPMTAGTQLLKPRMAIPAVAVYTDSVTAVLGTPPRSRAGHNRGMLATAPAALKPLRAATASSPVVIPGQRGSYSASRRTTNGKHSATSAGRSSLMPLSGTAPPSTSTGNPRVRKAARHRAPGGRTAMSGDQQHGDGGHHGSAALPDSAGDGFSLHLAPTAEWLTAVQREEAAFESRGLSIEARLRHADVFSASLPRPNGLTAAVAFAALNGLAGLFGRYEPVIRMISAVLEDACYMPVDDDPTYDAAMNELIAIRSAIEGGRTAAGLDAAELALLEESAEGEHGVAHFFARTPHFKRSVELEEERVKLLELTTELRTALGQWQADSLKKLEAAARKPLAGKSHGKKLWAAALKQRSQDAVVARLMNKINRTERDMRETGKSSPMARGGSGAASPMSRGSRSPSRLSPKHHAASRYGVGGTFGSIGSVLAVDTSGSQRDLFDELDRGVIEGLENSVLESAEAAAPVEIVRAFDAMPGGVGDQWHTLKMLVDKMPTHWSDVALHAVGRLKAKEALGVSSHILMEHPGVSVSGITLTLLDIINSPRVRAISRGRRVILSQVIKACPEEWRAVAAASFEQCNAEEKQVLVRYLLGFDRQLAVDAEAQERDDDDDPLAEAGDKRRDSDVVGSDSTDTDDDGEAVEGAGALDAAFAGGADAAAQLSDAHANRVGKYNSSATARVLGAVSHSDRTMMLQDLLQVMGREAMDLLAANLRRGGVLHNPFRALEGEDQENILRELLGASDTEVTLRVLESGADLLQVEHSVTQNPRMQLGVRMTTRWPPGPWIKYKQAEADELLGGPEMSGKMDAKTGRRVRILGPALLSYVNEWLVGRAKVDAAVRERSAAAARRVAAAAAATAAADRKGRRGTRQPPRRPSSAAEIVHSVAGLPVLTSLKGIPSVPEHVFSVLVERHMRPSEADARIRGVVDALHRHGGKWARTRVFRDIVGLKERQPGDDDVNVETGKLPDGSRPDRGDNNSVQRFDPRLACVVLRLYKLMFPHFSKRTFEVMPPGKLLVDVPTALNAVTGTFVDTAQPAAIDTICCSNGRRARLMDRIQSIAVRFDSRVPEAFAPKVIKSKIDSFRAPDRAAAVAAAAAAAGAGGAGAQRDSKGADAGKKRRDPDHHLYDAAQMVIDADELVELACVTWWQQVEHDRRIFRSVYSEWDAVKGSAVDGALDFKEFADLLSICRGAAPTYSQKKLLSLYLELQEHDDPGYGDYVTGEAFSLVLSLHGISPPEHTSKVHSIL